MSETGLRPVDAIIGGETFGNPRLKRINSGVGWIVVNGVTMGPMAGDCACLACPASQLSSTRYEAVQTGNDTTGKVLKIPHVGETAKTSYGLMRPV